MSKIIAFVSQKKGVGKSTLARALAHEVAQKKKQRVLLADCDPQQVTSYHWLQLKHKDKMKVEVFATAQQALRESSKYDLTIIDGPITTSHVILEIAQRADLVIQPTGPNLDDLILAVQEFDELVKAGVRKNKLLFVLNNLIADNSEEISARNYLNQAGYSILKTSLTKKDSYYQAQRQELAITEVIHIDLKEQAKKLVQEILEILSLEL